MRAAVCERYGPPEVLRVVDVPVPTPEAREVRIAVVASAVTSSDTFIRGLRLPPAYRALARLRMGLTGTPRFTVDQLMELTALNEIGALRPVVDRVFPLEQIVDAHRYVETGHKRGNVVVTMGDEAHPG